MNEATSTPFGLAVGHLADRTNTGQRIPKNSVASPYELVFKTPLGIKNRFSSSRSTENWYDEIKGKISQGEDLFEVYAYTPKADGIDESEVKIADVRL